ncbi:hypothetical protein [Oryzobacter telluris]|uniref:hypothetical protein n=1 Tax=Oryzobacter telluris TaxID=3149179 RepID=UPI00370D87EB
MTTPDTPRDETTPLADQVFEEHPTTTWAPAAPGTTTATAVRPTEVAAPAAPALPAREYVKGPAPFAIVLGLLGLVVAAATLFTEIVGIDVPWGDLGPWTVVGAGALVLLVGGLGLRASRGQD